MMRFIDYTPNLACLFTHSNPYKWPIHWSDKRHEAFTSYWGFETKIKAYKQISLLRASYPGIKAKVRDSKRLKGYKYEAKIQGLPWQFVRDEIAKLIKSEVESTMRFTPSKQY